MGRPRKYTYDKATLLKAYKADKQPLWANRLAKKFKLPVSLVHAVVYNELKKGKIKRSASKVKAILFKSSVIYVGINY